MCVVQGTFVVRGPGNTQVVIEVGGREQGGGKGSPNTRRDVVRGLDNTQVVIKVKGRGAGGGGPDVQGGPST